MPRQKAYVELPLPAPWQSKPYQRLDEGETPPITTAPSTSLKTLAGRKRKLSPPAPSVRDPQSSKMRKPQHSVSPSQVLQAPRIASASSSAALWMFPPNDDAWLIGAWDHATIDHASGLVSIPYSNLDVDASPTFIYHCIPNPNQVRTVLVPAFRHLLTYLEINPLVLMNEHLSDV